MVAYPRKEIEDLEEEDNRVVADPQEGMEGQDVADTLMMADSQ